MQESFENLVRGHIIQTPAQGLAIIESVESQGGQVVITATCQTGAKITIRASPSAKMPIGVRMIR